eukprot:83676_1
MQVSYENVEKEAETDEKKQKTKIKRSKKKETKSMWKNIQTTVGKYFNKNGQVTDEEKEKTFTDDILDHIGSFGNSEDIVLGLKEYLVDEEYDTDSIKNDIDIFDDEQQCNLLEA